MDRYFTKNLSNLVIRFSGITLSYKPVRFSNVYFLNRLQKKIKDNLRISTILPKPQKSLPKYT